jgi:hypothetical protein
LSGLQNGLSKINILQVWQIKYYFIWFRRIIMNTVFKFVCTIACCTLFSCWSETILIDGVQKTVKFDKEKFDAERAAWKKQAIKNYRHTLKGDFGGPITVTIDVINNAVTSITPEEEEGYFVRTIDKFFSDIADEFAKDKKQIDDKNSTMHTLIVEIEYDKTYHYPKKVSYFKISAGTPPPGAYNGYDWEITEFTPLK